MRTPYCSGSRPACYEGKAVSSELRGPVLLADPATTAACSSAQSSDSAAAFVFPGGDAEAQNHTSGRPQAVR